MKEITISLWEMTKEEAQAFPEDKQMLVYNPLMGTYKVEYGGKKCLANHKHVIPQIKYFSFEDTTL